MPCHLGIFQRHNANFLSWNWISALRKGGENFLFLLSSNSPHEGCLLHTNHSSSVVFRSVKHFDTLHCKLVVVGPDICWIYEVER